MATPRLETRLLAHTQRVSSLALLSDDRLASASYDASIRLWNLTNASEIGTLTGHTQSVTCVLVLPNGQLASASADRSIRIWDTEASCQVGTLAGHKSRVTTLCLLWQDESTWLLVSLGDEGAPKLWDVEAYSEVLGLCAQGAAKVTVLAAPFQGRLVTATSSGAIEVWDTAARQPAAVDESLPSPIASLERAHGKAVTAIAVLPGGFVATGSQDCLVKAWDTAKLTAETWVGRGHTSSISALATLPSGRLASAATDGTVKLWDIPRRAAAATLFVAGSAVTCLAPSPSRSGCLALGAAGDDAVHVWDIGEGVHEEVGVFYGHQKVVTALQALPGGRLASGDASGVVRMWDVASVSAQMHQRFELAAVQGPSVAVEDICALPDGGILVAWKDATLKVFDDSLNLVADPPDRLVHTLAVLGGVKMASGGPEDNAVTIWSLDGLGETYKLHGHGDHVISLTELPDGNIASGSLDNSIRIWDMSARSCVRTLSGHKEDVIALDILGDGHMISASYDNQIKVWDWQTGRLIVDLSSQTWGTGSCLTAMAATRSHLGGGWIATCQKEKTIRVWAHTGHGAAAAQKLSTGRGRGMLLPDVAGEFHAALAPADPQVAEVALAVEDPAEEPAAVCEAAVPIVSPDVQVAA